jgi:hypothetical protein
MALRGQNKITVIQVIFKFKKELEQLSILEYMQGM